MGLINVSGFHVDPGFYGKLIYAVYNAGPSEIHLSRGTEMFLIWFADLDKLAPRLARR
jgi:dCTP deaminase